MTVSHSVLVVDDDKDIRELLHKLFLAEGYRCSVAANGDEMFARLAQERFDLILLDVMMPGRDGFELCRTLQSDPAMPPVIMLTAKDEEIDRVVGLELGADDYIVKPFGRRELMARVKVVFRRVQSSHRRVSCRKSSWRYRQYFCCTKPFVDHHFFHSNIRWNMAL
jgi:two-component system OmpR family response regulator